MVVKSPTGRIKAWCLAAAVFAAPAWAAPVTVMDLVGVVDGFGTGSPLASGDVFDRFFVPDYDPGEGIVTDRVMPGGATLGLNPGASGSITSAQLEIFAGGWGLYGAAGVYVNGVFVGNLTIGEDAATLTEYAYLDTFDLTPLLAQLNLSGSDSIEIRPVEGPGNEVDYGAVDYARITIQTDAGGGGGGTSGVPEPATPALALLALGAAAWTRRRRA